MVMVVKRYKDYGKKRTQEVTPHKMTLLTERARQYRRELEEAEWNDELPSTIETLRKRVEMIEIQIALGEKYEMPF